MAQAGQVLGLQAGEILEVRDVVPVFYLYFSVSFFFLAFTPVKYWRHEMSYPFSFYVLFVGEFCYFSHFV